MASPLERPHRMWQIQTVIPALPIDIFVFLFGLVIGSFLNVCIVRIPEQKSIVSPASACPKCGAAVRPYDNIPVVSYLVLRGKCRSCKATISWMYPVVELLNALLFLACYLAFGLTAEALKWAIFSSLLIVLVFTDLRERILPDVVNFTGFGLALVLSLFTRPTDGTALLIANHLFAFPPPTPVLSLADSLLGAAAGSGFLWLVSEAYFRLRGREGMGLGDVKMMLMAGAFLGVGADAPHNFRGLAAGQRPGRRLHSRAAERLGLRIALRHVPRNGRAADRLFWNAARELVSIDAAGAIAAKSTITMNQSLPTHAHSIVHGGSHAFVARRHLRDRHVRRVWSRGIARLRLLARKFLRGGIGKIQRRMGQAQGRPAKTPTPSWPLRCRA